MPHYAPSPESPDFPPSLVRVLVSGPAPFNTLVTVSAPIAGSVRIGETLNRYPTVTPTPFVL